MHDIHVLPEQNNSFKGSDNVRICCSMPFVT